MKNYTDFSDNIKQCLDDTEILEFINKQEPLKKVYEEIKDSPMACVAP